MATLVARGAGWINLEPIVEEEDLPMKPGPFAFLGGSTHEVPTVTWVPGPARARRRNQAHHGGPAARRSAARVAWKLRDRGLPVPEGWRVTQDHPRRGLVASVPAGADNGAVMGWLLEAAQALCAVPATGRWRASVHSGEPG